MAADDAAGTFAGVMGSALPLAERGEIFMLSNMPAWARPHAVVLSVAQAQWMELKALNLLQ